VVELGGTMKEEKEAVLEGAEGVVKGVEASIVALWPGV
jgi:hypothetical protein